MYRTVKRKDERAHSEADSLGACSRVAERLDRAQLGHRADDLLADPRAFEANLLRALQKGTESQRIERAILDELRDRDRKAHVPTVHGEVTIH